MIRLLLLACMGLTNINAAAIPINAAAIPEKKLPRMLYASKPTILWTADWSPDGRLYAVGGNDGILRVYDAVKNKLLSTLTFPATIQCLDWNVDNKLLAIALDHQPVQVLNIGTKKLVVLEKVAGSRALAWKPDGQMLVVGDYGGGLHLYSKAGVHQQQINKENTKAYLSVDWHPKKSLILTGSDRIRLFDLSGKMLQNIRHRNEETIVLTVRWHPGGTFFAAGDYGHKAEGIASVLQYWTEDGKLIKSLYGSKAEYRNIRWNKAGTLLATASDALRLWSPEGQLVYTAKTKGLLWGIDWDHQSKHIITSTENGGITLWNAQGKAIKTVL